MRKQRDQQAKDAEHVDYDDLSIWAMSPLEEQSESDHAGVELATDKTGPMTPQAKGAAAENPSPTSDLFGETAAASRDAPQDSD